VYSRASPNLKSMLSLSETLAQLLSIHLPREKKKKVLVKEVGGILNVILQFPFHNAGENVWVNFVIVMISSKS